MTTVLVIDNCSVFCLGIRALLETADELELFIKQDHSLLSDEQKEPEILPDVLVLSSYPPELALPDLVGKYHQHFPQAKILVLLAYENEADIHQLVNNGTISCILKSEPTTKLVQALYAAAVGERYFSPALLTKLITANTTSLPQNAPPLAKHEFEVLRLVSQGKTNKEVAQLLQISERTLSNYLQSIRTKLDTQTTVGAVFRATQLGILPT